MLIRNLTTSPWFHFIWVKRLESARMVFVYLDDLEMNLKVGLQKNGYEVYEGKVDAYRKITRYK